MALNLNKGNNDEKSSSPSNEKKGLNLNKTESSSASKPNLSKDQTSTSSEKKEINLNKPESSSGSTINSNTGNSAKPSTETSPAAPTTGEGNRKNSTLVFAGIGILLLGGLLFWFVSNKNDSNQEQSVTDSNAPTTLTTEPIASQDSQTQDNSLNTIDSNVQSNQVPSANSQIAESPTSTNTAISGSTKGKVGEAPEPTQNSINNEANAKPTGIPNGSIEEKAKQVIIGAFGNGQDRKNALGAEYAEIQAKVNEIYKSSGF